MWSDVAIWERKVPDQDGTFNLSLVTIFAVLLPVLTEPGALAARPCGCSTRLKLPNLGYLHRFLRQY